MRIFTNALLDFETAMSGTLLGAVFWFVFLGTGAFYAGKIVLI